MKQYVVKEGDTLSKIAMRQLKASSLWPEIAKANNIRHPFTIFEGMRLDIPDLDQRNHVSVHAPAANIHLQDHVSVHAQAHDFQDHVSVHASVSLGVAKSSGGSSLGESSASAVMLPKLKIPINQLVAIVPHADAEISITVNGEITLAHKGSLADLKLGFSRKQAGAPFTKSTAFSYFNTEGEFVGTDEASMRIKSEYKSKILDLVGSPQIAYDIPGKTASVSCGLSVDAKVRGEVFVTSRIDALPPDGIKYSVSSGEVKGKSGVYEFSGKVGFEVEVRFKRGLPESFRSVPVEIRLNLTDKMFLAEKPSPGKQLIVLGFAYALKLLSEAGWVLLALP
jgi:hypothetical protein